MVDKPDYRSAQSISLFYPDEDIGMFTVGDDGVGHILARVNGSVLDYVVSMIDDEMGWKKESGSFSGVFLVEW